MILLLLITHIALAISALLFSVGVSALTYKRNLKRAASFVRPMWQLTGGALGSGVLLAIVKHSGLGSTCMSLFTFLTLVLLSHYYQSTVREKAATRN